jgi:hypothetical protein
MGMGMGMDGGGCGGGCGGGGDDDDDDDDDDDEDPRFPINLSGSYMLVKNASIGVRPIRLQICDQGRGSEVHEGGAYCMSATTRRAMTQWHRTSSD